MASLNKSKAGKQCVEIQPPGSQMALTLQSKDGHVEACRGTQRKHDKNIPTIAQFLPRKSEIHSDLTVSSISRAYVLLNVSIIAPSR